jgi:ribosomal protein S18 acetylase RimI-like enzyme
MHAGAEGDRRLPRLGRVVGDNGLFYQVVDIAVEPEHQRRGLGKAIVGKIVDHLKQSAPAGAHVSLADGLAHHLLRAVWFQANPTGLHRDGFHHKGIIKSGPDQNHARAAKLKKTDQPRISADLCG